MRISPYAERVTAVQNLLAKWEVDALYVTGESNRRWLSGFAGSNGQLLISQESALLATDYRYWLQAEQQAPGFTLFRHKRAPENNIAEFFQSVGVTKIGIESGHLTLKAATALRQDQALAGITWVELAETVEPLRAVKDDQEIAAIQAAAAITDLTMAQVPKFARPGMTEKALAWELEKVMRQAGAESVAFPVIVASGPNSALPHHQPGERELCAGDVLIVDLGARLGGYHSDLTRTFYLGDAASAEFWRVYELVLAAETAVFQHARPGMSNVEVDALARELIQAAGHGDHFGHGLGHGVGLDIHEDPFLMSRKQGSPIGVNTIVTIEPGIYLPGWGGIRLEDLALFAPDGLISLSQCPKEPIISLNP